MKTTPVPVKGYRILTPEEFDRLHAALPSPAARLLVETGLRWGELTELRLRDADLPSGIVTVSRSVVGVDTRSSADGQRVVEPYPKGRRYRRSRLDPRLVAALAAHVQEAGRRRTTCC